MWLVHTHISFLNLCGNVHSCFSRNEERGRGSVQECISLRLIVSLLYSVCNLLQVEFCLHPACASVPPQLQGSEA